MLEALMNFVSLCWKPFGVEIVTSKTTGGEDVGKDGLLWYKDIGKSSTGEFSMAVIQANQVLEDQSQIECGRFGTFVGVYDGHGGPDAARFVCDHLFQHFRVESTFLLHGFGLWSRGMIYARLSLHGGIHWVLLRVLSLGAHIRSTDGVKELSVGAAISAETDGVVTPDTIKRAFRETEEGFSAIVSDLWSTRPQIATVGTCCLVGAISQQNLFVANLGDSRAVLGRKRDIGGVEAIQLSTEHNANVESVRRELRDLHPDDPQIVMLKHGVWRVKGIIQVSRSIGDMYMKSAQYNREPINAKFRVSEPMNMPIMSAVPSVISHHLQPNDSFVIFASDGLWEHLSNETAVDIVHSHPHSGSARRLVKAALHEAARKREMRYSDLQKIDKKVRRHFHDDITVIVLFFNHDLISRGTVQDPPISIRCALEH